MASVLWSAVVGVDASHVVETVGIFSRKADAMNALDAPRSPAFKIGEVRRLEFASPYAPATRVDTVHTCRLPTSG
jgi:hypothetical protein